MTISGGKFMTGGVSIAIGKKDRAPQMPHRPDYTKRFKRISENFVVLYDVDEKRAWLSDGLSVLLHLVRASIKHDKDSIFGEYFLLDSKDIQESPTPLVGPKAALGVLLNAHNQGLKLYKNLDEVKTEERIKPDGTREVFFCHNYTY